MRTPLLLTACSLILAAGCATRDTAMVVPDRQGHARATVDSAPATSLVRVPRKGERIHSVVAGDTLSSLAKKHGVELAWLIERNNILDAKLPLKVGQQIIVPDRG
jgi:LysM repeat protein